MCVAVLLVRCRNVLCASQRYRCLLGTMQQSDVFFSDRRYVAFKLHRSLKLKFYSVQTDNLDT